MKTKSYKIKDLEFHLHTRNWSYMEHCSKTAFGNFVIRQECASHVMLRFELKDGTPSNWIVVDNEDKAIEACNREFRKIIEQYLIEVT